MLGVRRLLGGVVTPDSQPKSTSSSRSASPTKLSSSPSKLSTSPPKPQPQLPADAQPPAQMESFRGLPEGKRPNWPPPSPTKAAGAPYQLPISSPPASPGSTVKAGLFRRPDRSSTTSTPDTTAPLALNGSARARSQPRRAMTSFSQDDSGSEDDAGSVSDGKLMRNGTSQLRKRRSSVPSLPGAPQPPAAQQQPKPVNGTAPLKLASSVSITPNASPTRNAFQYDSPQSSPSRPVTRTSTANTSVSGAQPRSAPPRSTTRTSSNGPEPYTPEWRMKHSSSLLDTSDDLLLSLLASQAVVDSREFSVLSMDEVDELKREHALLSTRLAALQGKLRTETKIRNAAESLAKLHASHKRMSRTTSDQYEQAVRKVEQVEREIGKVAERVGEVGRRLGEHRAGVLAWSLTKLERRVGLSPGPGEEEGDGDELGSVVDGSQTAVSATGSDPKSPASVVSGLRSAGTSRAGTPKLGPTKFTGPHLFAGAEGATIPPVPKTPTAQKVVALELALKAAQEEAEGLRAAEKELREQLLRVGMESHERGSEVQTMRDDLKAMEMEMERLEGEELRASGMQEELMELRRERERWLAEREEWEMERGRMRGELEWAQMAEDKGGEMERVVREKEGRMGELEEVKRGWERLAREHVPGEGDALGRLEGHLRETKALGKEKESWEEERRRLRREAEELRERLAREVDEARREVEAVRREVTAQVQAQSRSSSPVKRTSQPSAEGDAQAQRAYSKLLGALQELWLLLPSAEARAQSGLGRSRSRTPTSATSPTTAVRPGGISPTAAAAGTGNSLSDMDVRTLKQLYGDAANGGNSPTVAEGERFSVEAFVARCKALMADDKALMERLIRFAQAHDLLKANAERSQRLAQEGRVGMETYQKQVRALEERVQGTAQRESALLAEISDLQRAIDEARAAKRALEEQAAIQAETCHSLSEANKVLSARALALAAEAADAPQAARSKVEAQVAELRKALQEAQDEVDAIKRAEVSQRAQLLDELNMAQTENQGLRDQLRARSAMK